MRKLAKPMIKNVGAIRSGIDPLNHINISVDMAQHSIASQNTLRAIFSIITLYYSELAILVTLFSPSF